MCLVIVELLAVLSQFYVMGRVPSVPVVIRLIVDLMERFDNELHVDILFIS